MKSAIAFCICICTALVIKTVAQDIKLVLPIGHTDKLYTAHFSPDGKKVVTASKDKTAKIWDVASGFLIADLKGNICPVWDAQFSPDGKHIFTYATDFYSLGEHGTQIKIWNAQTGAFETALKGPFEYIEFLTFSPDSKTILTGGDTLKIWDAATGKLISGLYAQFNGNRIAQFSPDSKWIAMADAGNSIKIFNAKTGQLLKTLKGHTNAARILQFTQDGKKLTTVSYNETLVWQVPAWNLVQKISAPLSGTSFLLTPNGKTIVTTNNTPESKTVSIWDAATRKKTGINKKGINVFYAGESNCTEDGALSGNYLSASNNHFAAVINTACLQKIQVGGLSWRSNDKTAKLWNLKSGNLVDSLYGHTAAIIFLEFSPDGTKVVTAAEDGTAKVWDANTGTLMADFRGHTFNSRAGNFLPVKADNATSDQRMVLASDNGMANIWDPKTGTVVAVLKSGYPNLFSLNISADGKKIISGSQDGSVVIWDAASGNHVDLKATSTVTIDPTSEADLDVVSNLVPPALNMDGSMALVAIQTTSGKIFDAVHGTQLFELSNKKYPKIAYGHFSPDGSKFVFGYSYYDHEPDKKDTNSTIFNSDSKKPLYKIEATDAHFSPDNKKLIANTSAGFKICDAETGKHLYTLQPNYGAQADKAVFSADSKRLFSFSWHDSIGRFYQAETGSFLFGLPHKRDFREVEYSPDEKKIATLSTDGGLETWDAENGAMLNSFEGHSDKINYFAFSPDGKQLVSSAADNTSKLWDAGSGKCLYTFIAIDSTDYFAQLPSGYYKSTPGAAKLLHYVTKDLKAISFEQLDVKYNRPDLVLAAIGYSDTVVINTYRNAYYKRIKKLGIDTTSFQNGYSVPEAAMVNRDSIAQTQTNEKLYLHVKGSDNLFTLDRYNIWVNEVPVYGQRGISIRSKQTNTLDTTVEITLAEGVNRIETSITNVNGTESYRMPLTVNYTPAVKQKETTYFIGIGIDQFANASKNLQYSVKDIRDLSVSLKKQFGNNLIIDTLFNENVTIENIKALKQKLQHTNINDKVIISYSGHGLLSKSLDYYLSTYSVNFEKPEENGLPYDEMENLLDSIPARKKLLLIDACHSGEVDKDDLVIIKATSDSMHLTRGGTVVNYKEKNQLGLKNSFELMQNLFVNVGKSTGATIISAAAGTQFALERNDLKNGVFTYSILEAMKNHPTIKISELKKLVGERVTALTNGLQKPTSRNETINVDWSVW